MANTFDVLRYRFHFLAVDHVRFAAGKAGNTFRGAFGSILRDISCVAGCPGTADCERREECAYARIFEPALIKPAPSGFADPPRPFVLRAGHLNGVSLAPGSVFFLDVNVFDATFPVRHWFERSLERLGEQGIGPGRGRAKLEGVDDLGSLSISFDTPPKPVTKLTLQFMTNTELKSGGELQNEPTFKILFTRIRDRISSLRLIYGPGPLDIDYRALGERAAAIHMSRSSLIQGHAKRQSTRTGQVHPLNGFTGEVDYEGELAEFVPWLECAYWSGVGRQTVWGKGQIRIIRSEP